MATSPTRPRNVSGFLLTTAKIIKSPEGYCAALRVVGWRGDHAAAEAYARHLADPRTLTLPQSTMVLDGDVDAAIAKAQDRLDKFLAALNSEEAQ